MESPATSVVIPIQPEDLEPVRLLRRWSIFPPPNNEILSLWHFWPALKDLPLTACARSLQFSPVFLLGIFERRKARWWQIMAEKQGIILEIEEVNDDAA